MSDIQSIFQGTFEVCCHWVEFWYNLSGAEATDELKASLTDEAEDRAKHCIIEGYVTGELNYNNDIRGWFSIAA